MTIHCVVEVGQLDPWWEDIGVHRHPIPIVVTPLSGVVRLKLGPRRHLDLVVGEAALLQPWVWHGQPRPWSGLAVNLGWSHTQGDVLLYDIDRWWEGQVPWPALAEPLQQIADAVVADRPQLLTRLLRSLIVYPATETVMSQPLRRMCDTVWTRRTRPITAAQILAVSGLSYTAAHDLFISWFGETPKRYLLHRRLDLARHLLSAGHTPGQVWAECGFTSRAAFTRRFRLVHGVPPQAWAATRSV